MTSLRKTPLDLEWLLTDAGIQADLLPSTNGMWQNLPCPFCGGSKRHLGCPTNGGNFFCFRCGSHPEGEAVAALLGVSLTEARRLCREHRASEGHRKDLSAGPRAARVPRISTLETRLPYGTGPMADRHRTYLRSRNFNPDQLKRDWGLLGTGNLGPFAHRIIIPIVSHITNTLCCYQGRDITNKSSMRYKSCPDALAAVPIKNCVYGIDKVEGDLVVVTEGAAKVWRLGTPAVCTFGATVTDAQVLLLRRFRRRVVLFDGDDTGRAQAQMLAARLSLFPGVTEVVELPGPGGPDDLTDLEARELMAELAER
ncbi:MAG: hypothetical protein WC455_16915 [Dehalococcoidia bacterium]|jgi:hypothetical protein